MNIRWTCCRICALRNNDHDLSSGHDGFHYDDNDYDDDNDDNDNDYDDDNNDDYDDDNDDEPQWQRYP